MTYLAHYREFKRAEEHLRAQTWFNDEGWTLRMSGEESIERGPSVQLSKVNWYNEDGMGIHYETWIAGEDQLKHLEMNFVLHVLHQKTFPGTDVKPASFMSRFRTRNKGVIAGWGLAPGLGWEPRGQRYGYHMKTGNMSAFSREMSFAHEAISKIIIAEFTRFRELGPSIDQILREILPAPR